MLMTALALTLLGPAPHSITDPAAVRVSVDSARKVVRLTAGPFAVAAGTPAARAEGGGDAMAHEGHSAAPFLTFAWPTTGWLRGVTLRITGADGRELSRRLIHHINVVNFDRRQLLYPAPERIIALGQETEDVRLPATVGVPIKAGSAMGLLVVWHNTSDTTFDDVTVTLDVDWLPANTAPRPLDVLMVYMDVRYPIGQPVDFDLPPGEQRFTADFTMPISGRIIGAGGHLHDFGTGLTLAEVRDGRERDVLALGTKLDDDGRLLAVERKYPGIRGDGIRLTKGRTYRMTGSYRNTTGTVLTKGAMVHLILLFAPERLGEWPAVDPTNADFARDLNALKQRGMPAGHRH